MNSLPNLNSAKNNNNLSTINQLHTTTNVESKHRPNKLSHSIAQINYQDKSLNLILSPKDDKSDKISVPSDLSQDLWGELPRHNYRKFLEQQKKEKQESH